MTFRIFSFDWDDINVDHIARHGVTPDEVEKALAAKPWIRITWQPRYVAYGKTAAGRSDMHF